MTEMEMINRWSMAVNYDGYVWVFKMEDFNEVMSDESLLDISEAANKGCFDPDASYFTYDPIEPAIYCFEDLADYPDFIDMPLFYGKEDITIDDKTMELNDWEELANDAKSAPAGFIKAARQMLENTGMDLNWSKDVWTDQDVLEFLKMRTYY